MMRGGRDEERQRMEESPMMFPRIHVNDRPKGGPRAPPRNKMALYEQFSIPLPSQRSSCGFASPSINFGGGLQNGNCVMFDNIPATSHSVKKQETSSSTGVRLNNLMETNELCPTSDTAPAPSLTASASLLQPRNSHFTRPLGKKPESSEDITMPRLANSTIFSLKEHGTEPCLELKRLESVDLESGERRGVPLPKLPILQKSKTPTPSPDMKNAVSPQSLERPRGYLSRVEQDLFALQDSASGVCRVSPTVQPKEGCNRSHSKLQHESVSASSCLVPDDVEKIIGQKNFWKARSALIKQRRVFAVQLFELHRIIKVQNLISRLPHILFEEGRCFRNSRVEVSPAEFLPKTKLNSETIKENATGRLRHGRNMETPGIAPTLQPKQRPSSAKMHEPENNNKPSMWCFPPTGNQWLVPVVSPSEGLVYKPYTGPGPPNMGIQDPISCPIKSGLGCGKEYSVSPAYFLHYGIPLMNSPMPNQTPERVNSVRWSNSKQPSEQVSQVVSLSLGKAPGMELEGSTASSPSERQRREPALPPFFPISTVAEQYSTHDSGKQQTKVIKVVPHNPRAATESAARIFRLIQEERRQLANE